MPTQCFISFGSNLGDRHAVMAEAAAAIARAHSGGAPLVATPGCDDVPPGLRTSRLFETPAIGGPGGQSPFLNAVAAFATTWPAAGVLDLLQKIEIDLGRRRDARWGARVIDLDVVLHGTLTGAPDRRTGGLIGGRGPAGSAKALVVPHPRYTARRFVLWPAVDVAADFCDPRFGWTIRQMAEHLDAAEPSIALDGGDEMIRDELCRRLETDFDVPIVREISTFSQPPNPDRPNPDRPNPDRSGRWVCPFVPASIRERATAASAVATMAQIDGPETSANLPRLIARIQRTTAATRWPAPHQIFPRGWHWPEYRLEVDDIAWAAGEIASALDSMRCELCPVTADGAWW